MLPRIEPSVTSARLHTHNETPFEDHILLGDEAVAGSQADLSRITQNCFLKQDVERAQNLVGPTLFDLSSAVAQGTSCSCDNSATSPRRLMMCLSSVLHGAVVAFDHMRVPFRLLPALPELMPALLSLFAEELTGSENE
eukprot:6174589-Pleurochrysis_carterae.AAC.1